MYVTVQRAVVQTQRQNTPHSRNWKAIVHITTTSLDRTRDRTDWASCVKHYHFKIPIYTHQIRFIFCNFFSFQ